MIARTYVGDGVLWRAVEILGHISETQVRVNETDLSLRCQGDGEIDRGKPSETWILDRTANRWA